MNASFQQAEPPSESVTATRDRNRERKRLQRERQRPVDAIVYETEDWQLFLSEDTFPQKAGCYPEQLAGLVLRELVDKCQSARKRDPYRRPKGTPFVAG